MNFYVFVVWYDIITLMIISNLMILIKNLRVRFHKTDQNIFLNCNLLQTIEYKTVFRN